MQTLTLNSGYGQVVLNRSVWTGVRHTIDVISRQTIIQICISQVWITVKSFNDPAGDPKAEKAIQDCYQDLADKFRQGENYTVEINDAPPTP